MRSGRKKISACGIRSAVSRCAGSGHFLRHVNAQNFLKHSLPLPSSALQSTAVILASGAIWTAKLLPSLQRTLQYA